MQWSLAEWRFGSSHMANYNAFVWSLHCWPCKTALILPRFQPSNTRDCCPTQKRHDSTDSTWGPQTQRDFEEIERYAALRCRTSSMLQLGITAFWGPGVSSDSVSAPWRWLQSVKPEINSHHSVQDEICSSSSPAARGAPYLPAVLFCMSGMGSVNPWLGGKVRFVQLSTHPDHAFVQLCDGLFLDPPEHLEVALSYCSFLVKRSWKRLAWCFHMFPYVSPLSFPLLSLTFFAFPSCLWLDCSFEARSLMFISRIILQH